MSRKCFTTVPLENVKNHASIRTRGANKWIKIHKLYATDRERDILENRIGFDGNITLECNGIVSFCKSIPSFRKGVNKWSNRPILYSNNTYLKWSGL